MTEALSHTLNPILASAIAEKRGEKIDGSPLFRRYTELLRKYGDGGRLSVHIPISETDKTDRILIHVTKHRRDQGDPMAIRIEIEPYPFKITTTAPPELTVNENGGTSLITAAYSMTDTGQRSIAFSQQTLDNYLNLADIIETRTPVEQEENRLQEEKRKIEEDKARIEKPEVMELASQMFAQSAELLRLHGIIDPDLKGFGKAKAIIRQRRELRVTVDKDGEKPSEILIESHPNKDRIFVAIGGLTSRLELSKNGPILHETGSAYWSDDDRKKIVNKEISLEKLTKYRDILSSVEQKLNPATKPPSPSHPTT